VHLVGFITRIRHDAWSHERKLKYKDNFHVTTIQQGQLAILQFTEVLLQQRRVFLTHFQLGAYFYEFKVQKELYKL
jgi:hypothetical protein